MPGVTNIKENGFETLIVDWLTAHNGYEQGNTAEYNKDYAVDAALYAKNI